MSRSLAIAATLVAVRALTPAAQIAAPDAILINGHIVTVDARFSTAQAVAIAGGKFVAVGTDAAIGRLAGPRTTTINLHGQTVIPGLADDHLHDAGGGPGVDLSRARTMADVLTAIAARVTNSRPGDVIVTNSDWHEAQLKEHRLPSRKDLDAVSPDNPVVVVRGGHEYILNSAALKTWNITRDTPQLAGGRITRGADGELNGELIDRAKSLVQLPPGPPLTIAGGTDSAVVPYSPLWVVYHFVTRATISGGVMGADQRNQPPGGAAARDDQQRLPHVRGNDQGIDRTREACRPRRAAGRHPDRPEKHIEQMSVTMTMVGGKVVYRRPS